MDDEGLFRLVVCLGLVLGVSMVEALNFVREFLFAG